MYRTMKIGEREISEREGITGQDRKMDVSLKIKYIELVYLALGCLNFGYVSN